MTSPSLLKILHSEAATVSWAVWPRVEASQRLDAPDLLAFDEKASGVEGLLHTNAVFVGLNRAGSDGAIANPSDWQNFHAHAKHNDHLLAAIPDAIPWLRGAMMTDLVDVAESDSSKVESASSDVARLVDLLRKAGATDPVLLALGGHAFSRLRKHQALLEPLCGGHEPRLVALLHYSSRNHWHSHSNRGHLSHPATYAALAKEALDAAFRNPTWGTPGAPRTQLETP